MVKEKKSVYVAGSLRHTPKEWWAIYEKIGKEVENIGFKTHIPHINTLDAVGAPAQTLHDPNFNLETRSRIYKVNQDAISRADLIIAEVTNPSTGTGIEIGWAIKTGKPVICLAKKGSNVTSMLLGALKTEKIDFVWYQNEQDAMGQLKKLLEKKFCPDKN